MPRFPGLLSLLALMLPPVAWAGIQSSKLAPSEVTTGHRLALVIGNQAHPKYPLQNPGNDARAMAAKLGELGFAVSLELDLGLVEMNKAFADFEQRIGAGDVALVYYSGHGLAHQGHSFLVPVDADIDAEHHSAMQAVDLANVFAGLGTTESRLNIVLLDTSRNDPFQRDDAHHGGAAIPDMPSDSILGYSTSPGMVAGDGREGHSAYTAALLDQLSQPGLDIHQMLTQVREQVELDTDGRQTPWVLSNLSKSFLFASPQSGRPSAR